MTDFLDICSCSVCLDLYKIPKRLPLCQHVYCKGCIDGLAAQYGGQRLVCPDCRTNQQLPDGTDNLLDDLKLNQFMSYFRCADCEEIQLQTSPCTECKSNTCEACKSNKHRNSISCDVIARLRMMKKKPLPDLEKVENLDEITTSWRNLQVELNDLKRLVTTSFEAIHVALVEEKFVMLQGIYSLDAEAEQLLASVNHIKKAPDFVARTWKSVEEFTGNKRSLRQILESVKVHQEALSAFDRMLTEDPARIDDIDIDPTGVIEAIKKMGEKLTKHDFEDQKQKEEQ